MAAAASIVAGGSKVLPYWLILTYLLHTFGELCLSPVGLSYVTKLAPKRFVGQMMGMWFLSLSLGNLAAGLIAGEFDANNVAAMPGQYLHIVYFRGGSRRRAARPQPSREEIDGQRAMTRAPAAGAAAHAQGDRSVHHPDGDPRLRQRLCRLVRRTHRRHRHSGRGDFDGGSAAVRPVQHSREQYRGDGRLGGHLDFRGGDLHVAGAHPAASLDEIRLLVDPDDRRFGRLARGAVLGAVAPNADHRAEAASFPRASPRRKCSK